MTEKIEELRKVRIEKLEKLKKSGVDPYPVESRRTNTIMDALDGFDKLSQQKKQITLAGRIRSIRTHGKLTFGNLEDGNGTIQFLLREDVLGEKLFKEFTQLFDMGDFLEVSGTLALSKTGEKPSKL
jgi:lysyl-tRNA synthetase class 2